MSVALFAILGANSNVGAGYWICFSIYCVCWTIGTIANIVKGMD
jgi:hypothetical protein